MSLFAVKGYDGSSLRDLAAKAEVDMALVGRLFGSKAALFDAVVDRLAEQQSAHIAQLRLLAEKARSNPLEAFKDFINLFAQISFEMPEFPSLLMLEASNPGERLETLNRRLVQPFRLESAPIVAAARNAGVVRSVDGDLFFGMLMSAIAMPLVSPSLYTDETKLTASLRDRVAQQAILMFVLDPDKSGTGC
jgi:AcrR family transcriptional regulator